MDSEQEAREWRDLLQSPGWARLKAYAAETWSPGRFEGLVAKVLDGTSDADVLSKLRQAIVAKRTVSTLLDFPTERLAMLKRSTADPDAVPSRRGAL